MSLTLLFNQVALAAISATGASSVAVSPQLQPPLGAVVGDSAVTVSARLQASVSVTGSSAITVSEEEPAVVSLEGTSAATATGQMQAGVTVLGGSDIGFTIQFAAVAIEGTALISIQVAAPLAVGGGGFIIHPRHVVPAKARSALEEVPETPLPRVSASVGIHGASGLRVATGPTTPVHPAVAIPVPEVVSKVPPKPSKVAPKPAAALERAPVPHHAAVSCEGASWITAAGQAWPVERELIEEVVPDLDQGLVLAAISYYFDDEAWR